MTRDIGGYLGVDSSLNGTGLGFVDDGGRYVASTRVRVGAARGFARLALIRDAARTFLAERVVRGWAIEGYSVKSTDRPFDLGSAFGVAGLAVYDYVRAEPLVVPPASLKLFAVGNGNAPKEDLLSSVKSELGVDLGGADDEADAICLARFAYVAATRRATKRHEADAVTTVMRGPKKVPRVRKPTTPSL